MEPRAVFQYLDYREFLRAHFAARKEESPWYSFKVMGDGVGLDQSQVFRILQGELHISKAALPRFVQYLNLEGPSGEYFNLLVRFARSKKEGDRRDLFAEMLELRGSRCRTLENDQLELYREWHVPVIRALLGFLNIQDDYAALASALTPQITAAKARKAVQLLERLGLVRRDADGFWRQSEKNLTTGRRYSSLVVRSYQEQSLQLAQESLDRHPPESRDISVTNLALDSAAFRDVVEILRDCRQRIQRRVEAVEVPDRVVRLAHAAYPVALTARDDAASGEAR